ncbi:membrane-bound lytic murein transglycosylase B [Streptomyces griseochromogenes]|uniref:Lytic transglycosylase n=1 Tax=Streptomyces griseochromogenes TaxID=68214 RepID=A0A1B1B6H4_9ACTN|nr:lytic transglycosylase domain-containing protein [Streptomyces griseochromogenes]ANP54425.1 lytic transglycosylase [Streptomyces griseochromogenes]MBP2049065.1 membrane-bound lytic murein transglycosylase B [Streptomyces griseochromogenes]
MAAHFGRRLRKGAATTAVAAAAVAALSASQAPGVVTGEGSGRQAAAGASTPVPDAASDDNATGNSPYYTDLPPLNSPNPSPSPTVGTPVSRGEAEAGIPATVLDAYKKAEAELRSSKPECNLPWQLLAAIGKVESGQARGGLVDANGTTLSRILGPQLDGNGFALIKDTDHGEYDGNSAYDQAVGPMQFIPSTWAWAGRDGNGDGKKDPNNVYDAALAAGHYLCRDGRDMSTEAGLHSAILGYNNSQDYLNLVLRWLEYYRKGIHSVPDGTGGVPRHRSDDSTPKPSGTPKSKPGHGPSHPGKPDPGKPDPGKPDPGKPGGGNGNPDPKPPAPKPPTPSETVDHLEDADTGKLTAMAGDAFGLRIGTRAETKAGKAVGKVRIRFTITGDTDATFVGGETVATIATDAKGVAVAPALQAGEKTGNFKITTAVVGHKTKGVDYTATVTDRAADTLARTSDTPLTCTPGGEFADQVQVKATYKGAVADKVAATATLIKSADDATENDKGPYFKDADGKTVRTLTDLRTDDKGLLTLPKLYADDTTGTFLLRITTTGGATLTVELKVAATDTSAGPSPSPSPSATS